MSRALHSLVLADLSARKSGWEDRQRVFYDMRHNGLPRQNKPLPDSADLHYPLVDGMIEKLKPFYFAQVWGQELLAEFTALKAQPPELTTQAARAFDWHLKEKTNLFRENLALDDLMLMGGTGVMKLWWEIDDGALAFDAVDPLFFIVPPNTVDLEKCDRVTQVMPMSVGEYERNWRYKQDAELIRLIKGKGRESDVDGGGKGQAKYDREGITCGETDEQIVLWETYKQVAGRRWEVHTYSPTQPDHPVRKPFLLPAQFAGLPFVDFPAEIKDKGYYASRGITERSGQFEVYLSRTWNEKADSMTWLSRPLLTSENPAAALNNIRIAPGTVLPGGIKRVDMGSVPFDFDAEMRQTREVAQEHAGMPDLGLGRSSPTPGKKTAREVDVTATLMQQTTDLRACIKRWGMARLYAKGWRLLAHFGARELEYVFDDEVAQLSDAARQMEYIVKPAGTPDNWNKPARQQRAAARAQLYGTNPYINQAELTKHVLDEDDPRLRRQLFQDPRTKAATQAEDQAQELVILREGWPAVVSPADDDNVHLQTVLGWMQKVQTTGEIVLPIGIQRVMQHVLQHLQQLAQRDKRAAAGWQQQFMQAAQGMQNPSLAVPGGASADGARGTAGEPARVHAGAQEVLM